MVRDRVVGFVAVPVFIAGLCFWAPLNTPQAASAEDEAASGASVSASDDQALNGQISKISHELEQINLGMAQRKRALQMTADEVQKTATVSELDHLREERRTLQQLLDRLVEAGQAEEGTAIDAALQRARKLERIQERAFEQQETIYDRRTK